MTRLEVKSRVGADGVLTLRIPVGRDEANQEVLVTVERTRGADLGAEEWDRFIRETAGSIADPTFKRQDPGTVEEREMFE